MARPRRPPPDKTKKESAAPWPPARARSGAVLGAAPPRDKEHHPRQLEIWERAHGGDPWPCCCDRGVGEADRLARRCRGQRPKAHAARQRSPPSIKPNRNRRRPPRSKARAGFGAAASRARGVAKRAVNEAPFINRFSRARHRPGQEKAERERVRRPSPCCCKPAVGEADPMARPPWLGRAGHHPIKPKRNRRRRGLQLGHDPAPRSAPPRQGIKSTIPPARNLGARTRRRPLAVLLRSGCWRSRPPSSAPPRPKALSLRRPSALAALDQAK